MSCFLSENVHFRSDHGCRMYEQFMGYFMLHSVISLSVVEVLRGIHSPSGINACFSIVDWKISFFRSSVILVWRYNQRVLEREAGLAWRLTFVSGHGNCRWPATGWFNVNVWDEWLLIVSYIGVMTWWCLTKSLWKYLKIRFRSPTTPFQCISFFRNIFGIPEYFLPSNPEIHTWNYRFHSFTAFSLFPATVCHNDWSRHPWCLQKRGYCKIDQFDQ